MTRVLEIDMFTLTLLRKRDYYGHSLLFLLGTLLSTEQFCCYYKNISTKTEIRHFLSW